MANVQNIPGLFGDDTQFTSRLAEIFGLDIGGFAQPTAPQPAANTINPLLEPLLAKSRATGFGRVPQAGVQQLQQGGPTPSDVLGLASAERIAGPSIFDQLGIADFAQRLTQPQGFGRTTEQDALIQELIGITGGASALRGLGSPTSGAIAQNIAPTLAGFRQQNIQNQLATLLGLTGAAGVGATERLGGISQLLDLTGLTLPTPIVEGGGGGGGDSIGGLLGGLGNLLGGFGSFF